MSKKKKKKITKRRIINAVWIVISTIVVLSMIVWTVAIGF